MTFAQYWLRAKISPELLNLKQKQLEAIRKMMNQAYNAGVKDAMKRSTT